MNKQAIIIGAGISGLSLAWFLKQKFKNIHIKIFEKSGRAGGLIQTKKTGEGFLFEQGPHSFRGSSPETLKLIQELNLQHELITPDPSSKNRYIYTKNELVSFPKNILEFICSPFLKMAIKALWRDLRTPQSKLQDESIYQFAVRRFGIEVAEQLFDPFVTGIYGGDITQLSIASCFPDLHQLEQAYGSILRGIMCKKKKNKSCIYTFKNGMEVLPRRLAELMQSNIHYNAEVSTIETENNSIKVTLTNGTTYSADHIFSTIPAKALAKLVDKTTSEHLSNIPSTSLAIVNLGFDKPVLNKKGFGYLIPSKEKQAALGVIFDSCVFPQQQPAGASCMTVIMGGMRHPNLLEHDDVSLKTMAAHLLATHLNIRNEPSQITIHRAAFAIPQYPVGYKNIMTTVQENLMPNLTIAGSFAGVSINDCILNSKNITNNCKKWD